MLPVTSISGSAAARSATRPSDAELVAQCILGDAASWRALYDRHAPAVLRFIGALGVPSEEREDAAQEVFVSVYRSLSQFRGEAQLSTWIYRIAARHASRLARRRRMRDVMTRLLVREPQPVTTPDPAERAAHVIYLERLLSRVSAKKRAVLVLFEIEGVPVEEIAEIVGCPVNTVWSRLHHARLELAAVARKEAAAGRAGRAVAHPQTEGQA